MLQTRLQKVNKCLSGNKESQEGKGFPLGLIEVDSQDQF
jgi:hypothetical protein